MTKRTENHIREMYFRVVEGARKGGLVKSAAKTAACRINGCRPKRKKNGETK